MEMHYAFGIFLLVAVQILQTGAVTLLTSCKNGGKPLNGDHPKCRCSHGYKGYDCNQKVTACEGHPCRNSGQCIEHKDGTFSCKCPSNYDGLLCEKRVRPCDSHPCQNGGKCSDDGDKCFTCKCPPGFKATDCSEKVKPCEVFPCKNGGVCANEKYGGFKCVCKKGYGGIFCERKDALFSSTILDGNLEYLKTLEGYLGEERDWRLCYRATRDSFESSAFHSRCDHKGPTVTLVRVGYSSNMKIFGGYTDINWGGSTGYKQTKNSFLFTLRNTKGTPAKCPIYKNFAYAIYTNPSYGPTFGNGHDLYVASKANANSNSYTNLGSAYQPPFSYSTGSKSAKEILAGTYNYTPIEVEVFYLV